MLYATARKLGFGRVLIETCCAAVGIGRDQTSAVSYNAMDGAGRIGGRDLRALLEVPGVKTQFAAWGFRVSEGEDAQEEEEDAQEEEDAHEEIEADADADADVDAGANRRGCAGAKKGSRHKKPVPDEYRGSGLSYKEYNDVMIKAGQEIRDAVQEGVAKYAAADIVRDAFSEKNLEVSARTLVRFADDPSRYPQRHGGAYFSEDFEKDLADGVRYLRSMNLPVYAWQVKETVRQHLVANGCVSLLKDGEVTDGWFRGFLSRRGLDTGNMQPLETTRAEWMTSHNYEKVFDSWAKIMTDPKNGLAEVNPSWNPRDPNSARLIILHPNRIGSFDETCIDPNQMDRRKTNLDKIVKGKGDDGSTVATKGKTKATGVFGRIGEFALPPFIIFGGSGTLQVRFLFEFVDENEIERVVPFQNIAPDEHGEPLETLYWSNNTGSMTSEACLRYLEKSIIPAYRAQGVRDEDGQRGILFFDGVGCHLSYVFLMTAKKAGIVCATRVPNSSSETQGEDTVHFRILKPEYFQQKGRRLAALVVGPPLNQGASLSHNDLKFTLPPAFNKAFTKANIAKAFASDGTVPWTQTPLWLAREREAEVARQQSIQDARSQLRDVRPAPEVAMLRAPAAQTPGAEGGARRGGVLGDDFDEEGSDAEANEETEEAAARPGAIVGASHFRFADSSPAWTCSSSRSRLRSRSRMQVLRNCVPSSRG